MILLDTNVISEFMREKPDPKVLNWFANQKSILLNISTISVAEISRGISRLPDGKRKANFQISFNAFLREAFDNRILSFDLASANVLGELSEKRENAGRHVDIVDMMIAAIAYTQNATVATRNIKDFEDCGVALVNPWS